VLGAGIFSAVADSHNVHVSGIWWLWIVATVPLTLVVMICWWYYKRLKARAGRISMDGNKNESLSSKKRTFFGGVFAH